MNEVFELGLCKTESIVQVGESDSIAMGNNTILLGKSLCDMIAKQPLMKFPFCPVQTYRYQSLLQNIAMGRPVH